MVSVGIRPTNVGSSPAYVATFELTVPQDASTGSRYEIAIDPASLVLTSARSRVSYNVGPPCVLRVGRFGDVNLSGDVDILDIFCVLDGFVGELENCAFQDVDIAPCGVGDGRIDIFDIFAVLDAFSGVEDCSR